MPDSSETDATACEPGPSGQAPLAALSRDDPRAVDFRNALRPWFRHAPWSSVGQEDLRAWLYWAVFNGPLPATDALPHAHATAMEEVEEMIRNRAGCTLSPGSNTATRPLLLTVDAVNVWARPLFWYLFVASANLYLRKRMEYNWGVKHGVYDGIE